MAEASPEILTSYPVVAWLTWLAQKDTATTGHTEKYKVQELGKSGYLSRDRVSLPIARGSEQVQKCLTAEKGKPTSD